MSCQWALHQASGSRAASTCAQRTSTCVTSPRRDATWRQPLDKYLTRRTDAVRFYSSSSNSQPPASSSEKPSSSSWDNLFDDVDIAANVASPPARRWVPLDQPQGPVPQTASAFPRRQSLTAQESAVFGELFEKLFAQRGSTPQRSKTQGSRDPLSHVGIGLRPGDNRATVDSLYGKLRRKSKRFEDPTEANNSVEQKRLEMETFTTDRELLDWAIQNVFNASNANEFPTRIPDEPRSILSKGSASKKSSKSPSPSLSPDALSTSEPSLDAEASSQASEDLTRQFALQSSVYPHLLSTLIALFRDKFRNPHLALSIFATARTLSVPSYVFGCTTAVYNELIATRWAAFRDLPGVVEALAEMRTNGVLPDGHTRTLAMRIKREALAAASGASHAQASTTSRWEQDGSWDASDDILTVPVDHPSRHFLLQMDELAAQPRPPSRGALSSWRDAKKIAGRGNSFGRSDTTERPDGLELR